MTDIEVGEDSTCITDIPEEDLKTAIKVLETIAQLHPKFKNNHKSLKRPRDDTETEPNVRDPSCANHVKVLDEESINLYKHSSLRPLRKALADAYEVHRLIQFQGLPVEDFNKRRAEERSLKRQKAAEREQQKRYIASTQLRKGRVEKLENLKDSAKEEELFKLTQFMIPDGHVDTTTDLASGPEPFLLLDASNDEDGSKPNDNEGGQESSGPTLPILRSCYVCKVRFRNLHRVRID